MRIISNAAKPILEEMSVLYKRDIGVVNAMYLYHSSILESLYKHADNEYIERRTLKTIEDLLK